jgi:putative ABC transport system permease protein
MSVRRQIAKITGAFARWRRGRKLDRELAEEIRTHLEMEEQENREAGMAADEAHYAALRRFGNVALTKEESREMWGWHTAETLLQDLRYGLRQLRRNPGFTAVAITTLALGIGANTAIFSLVNTLLYRDLPVRQPERLAEVSTPGAEGYFDGPLSFPMFEQIGRRQKVFSELAAWLGNGIVNVEVNGALTRGDFYAVTGNFYDVLGVSPLIGRLLTPADVDLRGRAPGSVAVIGYGFWRRNFASDASALGKTIRVEGIPFTVVGVTRPGFTGMGLATEPDVTVPLNAAPFVTGRSPDEMYSASKRWLSLTGRLRDGVTLGQARAQIEALWPHVLKATVPADAGLQRQSDYMATRVQVTSAATGIDWFLRAHFTRPLQVLMAMVGLVLLVACVNLANLMLAKGEARSRDVAVRLALGASRWRVSRQFLAESLMLAAAGALAGTAMAYWSSAALGRLMMSNYLVPPALHLAPDLRVLSFTAAIAVLAGVLFALAPVAQIARRNGAADLQNSARRVAVGAGRLGAVLICLQVGLSVVLLASAGLLAQSLAKLREFNPGFRRAGVLGVQLYDRPEGYKTIDDFSYYTELLRKARGLAGVSGAALANFVPGWTGRRVEKVRPAEAEPKEARAAGLYKVSPRFFETLGMTLLRGRDFTLQDQEKSPRVALLSETLASELFPAESAVGRQIRMEDAGKPEDFEVVGVVSNARLSDIRSPMTAAVYTDVLQESGAAHWGHLLLRTDGEEAPTARSVTRLLNSMGHEYALAIKPLDRWYDQALLNERVTGVLAEAFGGLALLLAAVGLYGLMAFTVTRRTHEIGIRMALGARRNEVFWMVLKQTVRLVVIGIALGIPCALAATRLISHLLFGLSPGDPRTLLGVSILLLAAAVAAGYLPARRATRVDPMVALKCE